MLIVTAAATVTVVLSPFSSLESAFGVEDLPVPWPLVLFDDFVWLPRLSCVSAFWLTSFPEESLPSLRDESLPSEPAALAVDELVFVEEPNAWNVTASCAVASRKRSALT